jgi:aconitate hydratase
MVRGDFLRDSVRSVLEVGGRRFIYYSLPMLEKEGIDVSRLPISLRIILESMIRNYDGITIGDDDIENLVKWDPKAPKGEISFKVARVITQDFTGTSLILDLAVMREYVAKLGIDPMEVNPKVPVDLIIDHSVQVDFWGSPDALRKNIELEFARNSERYRLFKWAGNTFKNFRVFPPGIGIIHQVNLEYLSKVVVAEEIQGSYVAYFDTVIGTDSHTPMVNGIGVLGWGVGGVEAEAAMLGQPVIIPLPEVVGVHLYGEPREGVTATDVVLTVTELLRKRNVVGKFVEFFGEGVSKLSVPDRATIANMAPEYGSTTSLFPVDEETLRYLRLTGRSEDHVALVRRYMEVQGLFGRAWEEHVEYSEVVELDLSTVEPSISGPVLPWQRLGFSDVPKSLARFVEERRKKPGFIERRIKLDGDEITLRDGDVVIAAITSCTNTSNPEVMIGAGLIAKKAVKLGLSLPKYVKPSMAPGSRVVTEYLARSGLLEYLEKLGFSVVGYGCTTCIGNSGPLTEAISNALVKDGIMGVAVLSGNRNFEGRVHPDVRASYLMSPMLVVIYALAGTVNKDLSREPVAIGPRGAVYLKDLWPRREEIRRIMEQFVKPELFIEKYSRIYEDAPDAWKKLEAPSGALYEWDPRSTYIRRPPFLDDFDPNREPVLEDIYDARPLLILGDSISTDHISPAGRIDPDSPAGKYLLSLGVPPRDFNTYGARRGNHEVMVRGAFASKGVRNKMVKDIAGGYTIHYPSGEVMTVFDAAMRYMKEGVPLLIIAGKEYGLGSSRDWAARAPRLLGVRAVVAESFERIHRANLVGMGIIPLQFPSGVNADALELRGDELFDIVGLKNLVPRGKVNLVIKSPEGSRRTIELIARVETKAEIEYLKHGSILHYAFKNMLKELLKTTQKI